MNKNIKKITASALMICGASIALNISNINNSAFMTAYASDKSSLNLENISLSTGKVDFSADTYTYKVYFNKAVKNIDIKATPEGSEKRVRVTINDESVSDDDNYEKNFKLSVGENIFTIKVENRDDESLNKIYTLKIYRGTDENGQEIEQDIYLDYLTINGEEINLSKDKKVYDFKVADDAKEAKLSIEPEQSYYTVKIDDDTYSDEERYRKSVYLSQGKNEVKIKLIDGEEEEKKQRTYTINIYKGCDIPEEKKENKAVSQESKSEENSLSASKEKSGWIKNGQGKWYFADSQGKAVTNSWFFVNYDGTMAHGWINFGGSWYYLNENGAMETGWKNINGKWYYFYSDGKMAAGTVIDGYKINSDGTWEM